MSRFQFGNVVIVDINKIDVIVKSWDDGTHEVYVRMYNEIELYHEDEIKHFVYDKVINNES